MSYSPQTSTSPYDSESESEFDCFLPLKDRGVQSEYAFHADIPSAEKLGKFDDTILLNDQTSRSQHVRNLRLNVLREENAEVQRQKDHWEKLSAKQSEFHEGRREMINKLSRSVIDFENEASQAARRAEVLRFTAGSFRYHLNQIQGLHPEDWSSQCFDLELDRALDMIDDADVEFTREMERLEETNVAPALTGAASGAATPKDRRARGAAAGTVVKNGGGRQPLGYWFMSGLAFSLPFIVLTALAVVLVMTAMGDPAILSQR